MVMEKTLKYTGLIFIGLVTGFFLSRSIKTDGGSTLNDTTYVYDTTVYKFYDTIPVPIKVIENLTYEFYDTLTIYDTIPVAIDTSDIIADYYRLRIYDEVFADENLEFFLYEEVGTNRILNRSTSYRILRPDKIITKHHQYLYGGVSIYTGGASINLLYTNKRFLGGVGYDPMNNSVFMTGGITLLSF